MFFNLLDQNFVNNIDYTRSLIEIMLRLVTHAQKICPVLFHLIIKNYLKAAQENHLQNLEYFFLVESTKIENASFPYKTSV